MSKQSLGNCYICKSEVSKTTIKSHILKKHQDIEDTQNCYLLKIEGETDHIYWLYVDIPKSSTLESLDNFLRKIWLECCGHMSAFSAGKYGEISKKSKLSSFKVGDKLLHEYDFGTTTESLITIMGETVRKPQKEAVRLLARNIPLVYKCVECGKPAAYICCDCMYDNENPFYCEECSNEHEHDDMMLPVTNSPRMGSCAYEGDLDKYEFKK